MAYDWTRPPLHYRQSDPYGRRSFIPSAPDAGSLTSLALPPLGPAPDAYDATPAPYYGPPRLPPPSYPDSYSSSSRSSRSRSTSGSGRGFAGPSRGASSYETTPARSPGPVSRAGPVDLPGAIKLKPGQANPNERLLSAPCYPPVALPYSGPSPFAQPATPLPRVYASHMSRLPALGPSSTFQGSLTHTERRLDDIDSGIARLLVSRSQQALENSKLETASAGTSRRTSPADSPPDRSSSSRGAMPPPPLPPLRATGLPAFVPLPSDAWASPSGSRYHDADSSAHWR